MRCSLRFVTRYGLSDYDAGGPVAEPSVADYYEATVIAATGMTDPKTVANWISGELFRLLADAFDNRYLNKFISTLCNWWHHILAYFDERVTNGFVEGINRAIRGIMRRAYGYHSFDNFRSP